MTQHSKGARENKENIPPTQSQPGRTPQRQTLFPPIFIYHARDNFMHIQISAYLYLLFLKKKKADSSIQARDFIPCFFHLAQKNFGGPFYFLIFIY